MLSSEERRRIAARARGLYERVAHLPAPDVPNQSITPDSPANALLAAWNQVYSPGDPQAFVRRLAWDDVTPEVVAAAITAAADDDAPAWTGWLVRFDAAARAVSGEWRRDRELPFVEIWIPILHAAREALAERLTASDDVGPEAIATLERQLLRELSTYGELAVDESFSAYLTSRGIERAQCRPESSDAYRAFVLTSLEDGLRGIWETYPVLARQVALVAERWVESSAELIARLAADRSRLAGALNHGIDPGRVARVEPGLSDPHDGRRRVAIVQFDSGLKVAYKPRDLAIERAFAELAVWLTARGSDDAAMASLRVVEGDGYGWVEFAEQQPFDNEDAVRRYYRRAGSLVFVTYLLGSKDLHMENVVATGAGPMPIDLELLLQPSNESDDDGHGASCLSTGLLSLVEVGAGDEVYDVGGLRGDGTMPLSVPRREWRHLGSDAVRFVDVTTTHAPVRNAVTLDGRRQPPEAFRDAILDGFTRAYRCVLAHRDEALAPGGPLAAFRAAVVRVLVRPSNQYALLSTVRNGPRYQRDGVRHSIVADILHRPLAAAAARPREWPLVVEERRVVDALDVPRLVVPADGRTLYSDGRPILENYYRRSPLDAARDRLRRLSEEDCAAERRALALALGDSTASRFSTAFPADEHDPVAHAEWIGRELLARAAERDGQLVWGDDPPVRADAHYLYDGTLGPALFFAALGQATGAEEWARAARRALAPALAWARVAEQDVRGNDLPIGGCSGLGSIVYGLLSAGMRLGDESALDAAARVATLIDADRIAADRRLDVVGGAAGAVLALLALHRQRPSAVLMETALACGDHLVASHVDMPAGWAWPSADGRPLVGFAHGAAGVATALVRLANMTGRADYRDAAAQALAFVSSVFSPVEANWPIAAPDPADIGTTMRRMNAWCHGAPGIGLAGALALDISPEVAILTQARTAVDSLRRWDSNQADHLCCGHFGRADVLLTAGPRLGLPDAPQAARAIADRVLARARSRQHFRLSTTGFEYRVFDPGLFRGLSGIGYELLRLAMPARLPSILAFELVGDSVVTDRVEHATPVATLQISVLKPDVASLLGAMTFPAYRHLLTLEAAPRHRDDQSVNPAEAQRVIQPHALAAWVGPKAVGLLLCDTPIDSAEPPEILSLFVAPEWRNAGVATGLVEAVERALRKAGFDRLKAVWMTGRPSIPVVERILEKRGWPAAVTRTISVRFTPEEAARTPWFQRVKLPAGKFEIFPWSALTPGERDDIRRSHEGEPWIAKGLEPWDSDSYGFDPISSLGLRYEGRVVGWVINHRMSDDCVRFTCSFMRADLSRRGRILPLYTESIQRLSAAGIKECSLVTPLEYAEMAEFLKRRCASAVHYFGETRESVKMLVETGS